MALRFFFEWGTGIKTVAQRQRACLLCGVVVGSGGSLALPTNQNLSFFLAMDE